MYNLTKSIWGGTALKFYTEIRWDAVSRVLKTYRKANRYTQQKIADYLGIERTTYVKYETTRRPGLEDLLKLAALYQVPFEDFFKSFLDESEDSTADSTAVAGKPDEKNLIEVSEQELRLLNCYRNSIRKAEIMKSAEEIFNQDNEIIEEINND